MSLPGGGWTNMVIIHVVLCSAWKDRQLCPQHTCRLRCMLLTQKQPGSEGCILLLYLWDILEKAELQESVCSGLRGHFNNSGVTVEINLGEHVGNVLCLS